MQNNSINTDVLIRRAFCVAKVSPSKRAPVMLNLGVLIHCQTQLIDALIESYD
jgi:hypothetical protein